MARTGKISAVHPFGRQAAASPWSASGASVCLITYEHAMLPEIEHYYAGDMMVPDYKSEIWIPVKSRTANRKTD